MNAPAVQDGPASRVVPASHGVSWLGEGWRLFQAEPGVWVGITVVLAVIHVLGNVVPLIGPLALSLLMPVLFGGLMTGCAALDEEKELEFFSLFAGFRQRTGPLVMVGVLYLVASIVILALALGVMLVTGGGVAVTALLHGAMDSPEQLGTLIAGSLLAILLGLLVVLLLMLPLFMAWWFAPALVMLAGMEPAEAMKSSFHACMKNWVPITVYGIVVMVLMVVAALPLLLGFLVLIPVLIGSMHAGYRDIYAT